ncbi:Tetratricopeptide repeat protein 27 [Nymphon striatum]|nr:Tetratricopeptide repeat protein 27 [Nymphon striatum]
MNTSSIPVKVEVDEDLIRQIETHVLLCQTSGPKEIDLSGISHGCDGVQELQLTEITKKLWNFFLDGNFDKSGFSNVIEVAKIEELFLSCSDNESFREAFKEFLNNSISSPNTLQELNLFLVAVLSFLSVEEATAYHLLKSPQLLLIAEMLLEELSLRTNHIKSIDWWLFRVYNIHQFILDEKSQVLYNKIKNLISKKSDWIHEDWRLKITFYLECAHVMLYYHETAEAKEFIEVIKSITGLNVSLTGALGKRTQFQQTAVPQLLVIPEEDKLLKRDEAEISTPETIAMLPKNVALNDETLLNEVEFLDISKNNLIQLHPEEQAAMLLQCVYIQKSNPVHILVNEEMMPYIQYVLKQPKVWSLQQKSLVMRSKLENNRTKTVERAMKQLDEIVNSYRLPNVEFSFEKLRLFFAVRPLAHWEIESELAKLLMSLGVVKSALEVFTRLELWEEMILCYHLLQRRNVAEKLIREKLEIEETVKLWCLLGDSTDNIEHYEKAWELSNHKSARAQRSIGSNFYHKSCYQEALPYFLKSVEINSLQPKIWFAVAFSANNLENHELAAKAYRKCVSIEPDNFEAWNNLSNTYIQLKQKRRSFLALQEALRLNYENWHIWENYLVVSADCGEFDELLKSSHRLLDIKAKHYDVEVLGILVRAVTQDIPDAKGVGAKRLREKSEKLFGRITSTVTNDPNIWELYADLRFSQDDKTIEILEKVLHHLQKAHHCLIRDLNWDRDTKNCVIVMKNSLKLSNIYRSVSEMKNGSVKDLNLRKLMLKGIISSVQKKIDSSIDQIDSEIKELLLELETHFTENATAIENISKTSVVS